MKIGIVTTWFERGAAYVSRSYMAALQTKHEVYIYARGGEFRAIGDPNWDLPNVTWGRNLIDFEIDFEDLRSWIEDKKLDCVLFNEQQDWKIILELKSKIPSFIIGSYIDYYTEQTLPWFNLYDFVICNTKRHYEAMSKHPQAYYVPWGVDVDLYKPSNKYLNSRGQVRFFHSAGMSTRKGTELLIDAFISNNMGSSAELIIHTQRDISWATSLSELELLNNNITVIKKTVSAPGLYHMGDVYVYPTRLDGLGLTMYEALACGMPVITTDYPPMNEAITPSVGQLVNVSRNYSRADAYYWPMSECDSDSLASAMSLYIDSKDLLIKQSRLARERAANTFSFALCRERLCDVFEHIESGRLNEELLRSVGAHYKAEASRHLKSYCKTIASRYPRLVDLFLNSKKSRKSF